jgi:hypothetical protein
LRLKLILSAQIYGWINKEALFTLADKVYGSSCVVGLSGELSNLKVEESVRIATPSDRSQLQRIPPRVLIQAKTIGVLRWDRRAITVTVALFIFLSYLA